MAQLRNLGIPFGSPSGVINVPAPAGSALAGQLQMQAWAGLGQALGSYFGQRQQKQLWQQDEPGLQNYIRNMQQAQQAGGVMPQFPAMQSRRGREISEFAMKGQLGNIFATPKTTQASSVITDPDNPDKAIRVRDTFDTSGNLINRQYLGEATLAEKIGGVAAEGLQRGTKTKLEEDIIELQGTLTELGVIDKQFNEDFFTYRGKGKAWITAIAEKAEIPTGEAWAKFLSEKTKFFADSKRVFLKFRKFITGVAGGIEEFKEIAKATIDPEEDSATQFKSKMNSMRDNARRTQSVLLAIRNSGLDPNNKAIQRQVFKGLSLKSVPIEVPETVTLDTLMKGTEPKKLLISPFQQGDTPTATDPRTGRRWILKDNEWIERK